MVTAGVDVCNHGSPYKCSRNDIEVEWQPLSLQLWLAAGSDDSLVSAYTWEKKR